MFRSVRGLPLHVVVRAATYLALAALFVVLVRTAWLADDAYISFRTIRNFIDGDGLRWNLADRVQVFTHPLWVFLLAAFSVFTRDLYYTTYAVSFACTFAAVLLLVYRVAPTRLAGLTCIVVLVCSRSFVDYSTSGLENPLTHLLLVVFAWQFLRDDAPSRGRLFRLALIAGLATTNRLDTIVLVLPALGYEWSRDRTWRGLLVIVAGFTPFIAWEVFSVIYFGFPFPNTAYAKLPPAISHGSRIWNGGRYLVSCLLFDPLANIVLVTALVAPFVRRAHRLASLSLGFLLYVLYVVWVGGDFMGGRFLTAPLVLAVAIGSHVFAWPLRGRWFAPVGVALGLSLALGLHSPLIAGDDYGTRWPWEQNIDRRKVADERAVYHKITGLVRAGGSFTTPWHAWFETGAKMRPGGVGVAATVGFTGWAAPRDTFLIDQLGLGDAFMARLPPIKNPHWRPGHLDRAVPDGYVDTRRSGEIRLRNHWLAEYYQQVLLVTAGPLWSGDRWRAIWNLNTGSLDSLLTHHADVEIVAGTGRATLDPIGTLYVRLREPRRVSSVRVVADAKHHYEIAMSLGNAVLWSARVESEDGVVTVPRDVGFVDTVSVRVTSGGGTWTVDRVVIE